MISGLLPSVFIFKSRSSRTVGVRGRSRTRFARQAVGVGFTLAVASSLALAAAIETVKPEWRDPEYGYRLKYLERMLRSEPERPLALVLGTSRTQYGIDPAAITSTQRGPAWNCFNFGQTGSPPLKVLLTLERVLDAGIEPRAVFVEILPLWLNRDGSAEEQLGEQVFRLSAEDLRRLGPYCNDSERLREQWLSQQAKPWYTHRMVLMSHWLPRWTPWKERVDFIWQGMNPDGFVPYPQAEPTSEAREKALACAYKEYCGAFKGFVNGAASVNAISNLVARCRRKEIAVAFFVPPVSPSFRSWFAPRVWESGEVNLHALGKRLGVDVFHAPRDLADDEFVDGHHLLKSGADRYSRWLAETHFNPWFARQQSLR